MKKRVAILYTGQMRSNPFSSKPCVDNRILESIEKFFIHNMFKQKYNYDVFISTDEVNIERAIDFWGSNLKNVHITESDTYMNDIIGDAPVYEQHSYKKVEQEYPNHIHHLHAKYQYHRLYCAYNMAKSYELQSNLHYDFYVRIRLDAQLMRDLFELFNLLESTKVSVIAEHEQILIVKSEVQKIFEFVKYYGTYTDLSNPDNSIYMQYTREGLYKSPLFPKGIRPNEQFENQHNFDDRVMRFSPEKQISDHINFVLSSCGYTSEKNYIGITYPSYNLLLDTNGNYKHVYLHSDELENWKPYNTIEFLNMYANRK